MKFLRAEPQERGAAIAACVTLAFVLGGHAILETARDALFLRSLPVSQLPWLYLIIAALTLAVTNLERVFDVQVKRRDVLALTLGVSAVLTASLYGIADFVSISSIWILYVWTGLYATVSMLQFWLTLGSAFTVTQAKRLYGFVGAGALVGAIAGSGASRAFVSLLSTKHLVLVSAACMAISALCAHFWLRRALRAGERARDRSEAVAEGVSVREAARAVLQRPYLRQVVGFALLMTMTVTVGDFLFKREVAAAVDAEDLGRFFSTFYAGLNAVALVLQIAFVGWFLDRAGVHRTLAVLPILLLVAGTWSGLGGGLAAVVLLKGADGALKHSLHRTASEVLFVPLARELRDRAKTAADVFGHRLGQAAGSLLILVGLWLDPHPEALAWLIAVLAGIGVVNAWSLRKPYLDVFRETLGTDARIGERTLPPLDRHSLETLFAALDSPRDREVIGALDLLREQERIDLVPALILHHPSAAVVLRALTYFVEAKRRNFVATALRVETENPDVRAALLGAISSVEPDPRVLHEALNDGSRRVRATAMAQLAAHGWMPQGDWERQVEQLLAEPAAVRRALAAAIAIKPAPAHYPALRRLLADDDPLVSVEAARAMAAARDAALCADLLGALNRRALRPEVRRGLVQIGTPALEALAAALTDPNTPHELRLHVPRSISRFPPDLSWELLWRRLAEERDAEVRYKILRALGSLSRRAGGLTVPPEEVAALLGNAFAGCEDLARWHEALSRGVEEDPQRDTGTGDVLRGLLRDELEHRVEEVFRVLSLHDPEEDFRSVYRGLRSDDPAVRASSEELLAGSLAVDLRRRLSSVLDAVSGRGASAAGPITFHSALEELVANGDDALASIAALYAAELGQLELSGPVEARRSTTADSDLRAVFARAANRLLDAMGERPELAHG